jgi:hypothetical protein
MTSAFPRPCARTRRSSPPTCCTHRAGSAPPAALINRRWGPPSDQADRWLLGGPASGERPPAQTKQRTIRSAACPLDLRSTPPAAIPAPLGVLCEVRRRRRRVPRLDRDGPPADRRHPRLPPGNDPGEADTSATSCCASCLATPVASQHAQPEPHKGAEQRHHDRVKPQRPGEVEEQEVKPDLLGVLDHEDGQHRKAGERNYRSATESTSFLRRLNSLTHDDHLVSQHYRRRRAARETRRHSQRRGALRSSNPPQRGSSPVEGASADDRPHGRS